MTLTVGIFGTYYPDFRYVGSVTTGMVEILSELPDVGRVIVYCPRKSSLPEDLDPAKVELRRVWEHNNPVSLWRAFRCMTREASAVDMFVFNTYLTAFGSSQLSNALGLLLPVLLTRRTRRPVVTYMHNLLETQDVQNLGYHPSALARLGVNRLEALVIRETKFVVPLEGQRRIVERVFGRKVTALYLPYLEAVRSLNSTRKRSDAYDSARSVGAPRLLLFGFWGPQKDLSGALEVLTSLIRNGTIGSVTLAGTVNTNFLDAQDGIRRAMANVDGQPVRRLPFVSEDDVLPLFLAHDVILLPYRATGGMSAVMDLAAFADLTVVAYDHPQLREQAAYLGLDVLFVPLGRPEELRRVLATACGIRSQRPRPAELRDLVRKLQETRRQVGRLVSLGREA